MKQNRTQFQKGMSLTEFLSRWGSEAQCRDSVERSRWPDGFRCPECECTAHSRFDRGNQRYYQCRSCRHQTSLSSGTLFESSKLPLRTWFLGLHLLTATKTNLSALELKRQLGLCYRSAWRLKHKVMQAMTSAEESRKLNGLVQVDDAYLGGERNGGKPGRGSENKQALLIAVETEHSGDYPRYAVIEPVRGFTDVSIIDWAERRLAPQAEVVSDGLFAFRRFNELGHAHTVLTGLVRRAATQHPKARWANIVLANVKRAISGRYHSIRQAKYARRYLAEAAYRFNRRFHLRQMLPDLIAVMSCANPLSERRLRLATNYLS